MLPVRAGRTTSAVSPARRPLRRSVDHRHRFPARAQTLTRAHSAGDMRDCFGHVPFHAFDAQGCLLANLFVTEADEPVRHEDFSSLWTEPSHRSAHPTYYITCIAPGQQIRKHEMWGKGG